MSPSEAQDAACSAHPTSSGQWNFRSSSVETSDENTPSAVCLSPPDAGITGWLCGEVRQCIHQSRAKHLPGSPRRGNRWLAMKLQLSPKHTLKASDENSPSTVCLSHPGYGNHRLAVWRCLAKHTSITSTASARVTSDRESLAGN